MILPTYVRVCVICQQYVFTNRMAPEEPIQDRHEDLTECVRALGQAIERLENPSDDS